MLVFVGFGAKSGLAPMHTWLPDAHSQAPTPICGVLSGVKTTVPLYVILRFLSIVLASPAARVGNWMIVLSLVSVGIAAFLLIQVRDYKRMFAYSTVEHIGIILTAAGMATQAADFGAVSQILNHAITKSLCFYVARAMLLILSTREIASVRGLLRVSPFAGAALLLSSLAIAGAPPFPIFLSELSILSAGVRAGHKLVVPVQIQVG
ncbi:MAG: proton-conducting transporter membrane subunit [Candidatus Sulfotelmatobacter sp.]